MKLRSVLTLVTIGVFNMVNGDCNTFLFNKFSVNPHSTPYGNQSAGTYTKVNEADNLPDCVEACCEDSDCNMAFLFNTDCFSLQCHNYKLCQPLKRKGKKFKKSFVVIVRVPEETLDEDVIMDNENNNYPDFNVGDVTIAQQELLMQGEEIETALKTCLFGLNTDCPENEHCVPKNNRARSGFCKCEDGFDRNVKGICTKKSFARNSNDHIISPSTVGQVVASEKNSTAKSLSTDSSVHQLVVSAGDNVTLHLPENEVTLSAYAVQQLEGDTYKYEWTLISHPEGDETGTMQDQNTKNLKLSKLRAGLYTFKVTVSSENAVGEAMVNVTVLPPERENKPPVAIIQPSSVTVKLPNKDTVLDGSYNQLIK